MLIHVFFLIGYLQKKKREIFPRQDYNVTTLEILFLRHIAHE